MTIIIVSPYYYRVQLITVNSNIPFILLATITPKNKDFRRLTTSALVTSCKLMVTIKKTYNEKNNIIFSLLDRINKLTCNKR